LFEGILEVTAVMFQTQSNRHEALRTLCILFVAISLVSSLSINVTGQDTLTFTVNRNVGMAFGSYISGTFTLHGSGPDTIQNLTVYFNDVEVHFVMGNTITWQFNTGNYEGGATNITLIGFTDSGTPYTSSITVVFIGESVNTLITIGIIALVSILILAKYGPRLMNLRNK
jgi:hypothetical protein